MTAKRILLMPRIWIRRSKAKVKAFLDRRTQRERLWIIVGMLVIFAVLDIWQLIDGLSTERPQKQMEHILEKTVKVTPKKRRKMTPKS